MENEERARTKLKDPQIKIRVPNDLKKRIEEAANEKGRSRVAEILYRLRKSFGLIEKHQD